MAGKRVLRVAVVQARSVNGAVGRNLDNCTHMVSEAAGRGAALVLCPEFLAAGYTYDESLWLAGEPRGGLTETWLLDCAHTYGITVGASYLEAEGEHFYNTFALATPGGIAGRVRKRSLPFFEGWFFEPCHEAKVLNTDHGRVAVGICNDNQTAEFMNDVIEHRPDIILMPHSAPSPKLPRALGALEGPFRRLYDSQLKNVAQRYSKAFGVPVLMSNKGSAEDDIVRTTVPDSPHVPFWPRLGVSWTFEGHSTIVDGDGSIHGYLKGGEGVLVADVTLDPTAKREKARPKGYWSFAPRLGSWASAAALSQLARIGRQAYRENPRRRAAALACQSAAPGSRAQAGRGGDG